jgi:hypothetical protein
MVAKDHRQTNFSRNDVVFAAQKLYVFKFIEESSAKFRKSRENPKRIFRESKTEEIQIVGEFHEKNCAPAALYPLKSELSAM